MEYGFDLKGLLPGMFQHSVGAYADPEIGEKLGALMKTAKSNNPEDVYLYNQAQIEHSLYLDDKGNVVIPAANLQACLILGCKLAQNKVGQWKGLASGFIVTSDVALYDSSGEPITRDRVMSKKGQKLYWDIRMGRNPSNGVPIPLVRPLFKNWVGRADVEILDESAVTLGTLRQIFAKSGSRIGLGNWRPNSAKPGPYGRFEVTEVWELDNEEDTSEL